MKLASQFHHLFTNKSFKLKHDVSGSKWTVDTFLAYVFKGERHTLDTDFAELYHLLDDVPMDIFISMKDKLIKP